MASFHFRPEQMGYINPQITLLELLKTARKSSPGLWGAILARFHRPVDHNRVFPHAGRMANSFGQLFRITTWGESHGGGVGVVVDGCPPRIKLSEADIQPDLDRRRPGQSKIVTPRKESDSVQILSGTFGGRTLGTPISMWVKNEDARPEAYSEMATKFRPSHADFTYQAKYGIRNWQGGGRTSARETIGRVAAGAIAKKILREQFGVEVLAYVKQVQRLVATVSPETVKSRDIEANIVRCPDSAMADKMIRLIEKMRRAGDSVGGIVEGLARGVPVGWGEPVFDRLEADLAKAMLSLPASKGFDIGSGFGGITLTGLEHNDIFRMKGGKVRTLTNRSGGIQGGISNGETIYFRVAFKPVATVMHEQDTVDETFHNTTLKGRGRHDPCVLPRAVPMVEAMTALVLVDHALRHKAQCG
ncbi:MAG: chorismate synthase [Pedosphaera sp.]|nr:chorismate synthase [Pedosphaera sp.]